MLHGLDHLKPGSVQDRRAARSESTARRGAAEGEAAGSVTGRVEPVSLDQSRNPAQLELHAALDTALGEADGMRRLVMLLDAADV